MSEKCILDPERDCLGLMKAREIEEELDDLRAHNEKNHKEFFDRLATIEAHNKVQDAHYEHIIEKLTDITDKLSSLGTRLAAIEFRPAKKWESIAEKIIWFVIAAVLGLVFAKIGLQ